MKDLFTSESVGAGHPDKICDQISDSILDAVMEQDNKGRVAIETMASNHLVIVGGELTTTAKIDPVAIAWGVLENLGYTKNDFTVMSNVNSQSPDINQGVDKDNGEIGAGDQGIMFGYATNETPEYMPLPITMAHAMVRKAEDKVRSGEFKFAKFDAKSQVTIDYTDVNNPRIETMLMSIQHEENYNEAEFKEFITEKIMKEVATEYNLNHDFNIYINPTGKFVIGGPIGDTGLTGRKIIVDTYGGMGRHGGGAFSGKDYTKVDRSAAYAARWVAKNVVAAGLADRAEVQLSYAIGVAKPLSISIECFGTNKIDSLEITERVAKVFDLSPAGIFEALDLMRPIYKQTASYGHFGRPDLDLPWEKLNMVDKLK